MSREPGNTEPDKYGVLIVDDHSILREGLAMVINEEPDLQVRGEAADAREAFRAIASSRPDVVIADLSLANGSGLDLIKDLKAQYPDLPVLVLSLHDEALYAERVLRAGARGYIMKRASAPELLAALRKVLQGEIYLSERMGSAMAAQAVTQHGSDTGQLGSLSDRELEVFRLLGEGHGTRRIARELGLSMKTVSCYRQNIKNKLNLKDATELMQRAVHLTASMPVAKPNAPTAPEPTDSHPRT
ncbi:MAG TPA: response regulator transcription factor [Verrucomicrobiae bacterium]|nr:response regulator transcription factor [Verrucomicrobiae bacterium]